MRRYSILAAACFMAVAPLSAQQPVPAQEQEHLVRTGDTLWDLAQRYLSDPYRWPEIFSRNSDLIANPHWIFPLQRILIPGTREQVAADATAVALPPTVQARTVFFQSDVSQLGEGNRVVAQTRADEVPVVRAGSFYDAGLLMPDSLMAPVGRIEEVISPSVVRRDLGKQIQPFDRVYVSVTGPIEAGGRLHFMRPGREVASYGRIFIATGTGRVVETAEGRATVEIDGMYDQIQPGDLVVPMPVFAVPSGVAPEPASSVQEGVLLAFEPEQPVAARDDLAYVNLGRENGITEGDEFVAYLPASVAEWGMRPALDVARLQVVRAGARTSAVRVVSMQQPALTEGLPIRLVARMP